MITRKLLASAAAAAAALSLSTAAYAATHGDAHLATAGAPDMLGAHGAGAGSTGQAAVIPTGDPSIAVTTLTQAQYNADRVGLIGCVTQDGVQFCQNIVSRSTGKVWDVYADLGRAVDLANDQMYAIGIDRSYAQIRVPSTPATVAGPYVHLHWNDSDYDIIQGDTSTQVTIGDTQYNYTCSVSQQGPGIAWPSVCSIDTLPAP